MANQSKGPKKRFASQPRGIVGSTYQAISATPTAPKQTKTKKKKGHAVLPSLPPVKIVSRWGNALQNRGGQEPNASFISRKTSRKKQPRALSAISSSSKKSGRSMDSVTSRSFGGRKNNLTNQSMSLRKKPSNGKSRFQNEIGYGIPPRQSTNVTRGPHSKYIKNVMTMPNYNYQSNTQTN
jgi:hypothetical protein